MACSSAPFARRAGARSPRTARLAALQSRLAARQPVVVLLSEGRNLYHYVVVVGISSGDMVVHDPSWGPFRLIPAADFERRWTASHHWSLVILPATPDGARGFSRATPEPDGARGFSRAATESDGARGFSRATPEPDGARGFSRATPEPDGARGFSRATPEPDGARGLSRATPEPDGARGFSRATPEPDGARGFTERPRATRISPTHSTNWERPALRRLTTILGPVRARCPDSAGPLRELAAARFAERRWADAAVSRARSDGPRPRTTSTRISFSAPASSCWRIKLARSARGTQSTSPH